MPDVPLIITALTGLVTALATFLATRRKYRSEERAERLQSEASVSGIYMDGITSLIQNQQAEIASLRSRVEELEKSLQLSHANYAEANNNLADSNNQLMHRLNLAETDLAEEKALVARLEEELTDRVSQADEWQHLFGILAAEQGESAEAAAARIKSKIATHKP